MAPQQERVFFVGGTGNTGLPAVKTLLDRGVAVTLYARDPAKVASLLPGFAPELLNVVQGDVNDFETLKAALPGHSRLFMVIYSHETVDIKVALAKAAYAAGIKQIVDVSVTLNMFGDWRVSQLAYDCYKVEKAISERIDRPKGTYYVSLRPGRFMSNVFFPFHPFVGDTVYEMIDADTPQGWVSPNDIGLLAANVLSDDLAKHNDAAYEMISDSVTPAQRVDIYSRVLGRNIKYEKISIQDHYNRFFKDSKHLPFRVALELGTHIDPPNMVEPSPKLPILLGRDPETLEQYIQGRKNDFIAHYNK